MFPTSYSLHINVPYILFTPQQCSLHLIHSTSMFPTSYSLHINVPYILFTPHQCSLHLIHSTSMFPTSYSLHINVPYILFTPHQCSLHHLIQCCLSPSGQVACPALTDPVNGVVSLSGVTQGSTATYTCNIGFTISGALTRTCGSSGAWLQPEPSCQSMYYMCV